MASTGARADSGGGPSTTFSPVATSYAMAGAPCHLRSRPPDPVTDRRTPAVIDTARCRCPPCRVRFGSHVLSGGDPAALDVDDLAVDVASPVRRQEEHRFRNLAGVSESLHGVHRLRLVDVLGCDAPLLLP